MLKINDRFIGYAATFLLGGIGPIPSKPMISGFKNKKKEFYNTIRQSNKSNNLKFKSK